MKTATHSAWKTLVVGLGITGLSVARYLTAQGIPFAVIDSREDPPGKEDLVKDFPEVAYWFGEFAQATAWFEQAQTLVVSPGIAIATPEIHSAQQRGAEIIGDIELFVRAA